MLNLALPICDNGVTKPNSETEPRTRIDAIRRRLTRFRIRRKLEFGVFFETFSAKIEVR